MVGPLMLLKLLHCKKRRKDKKKLLTNTIIVEPFVKEEFQEVAVKKELKENGLGLQSCRVCLKEGTIPIFGDLVTKNISMDLATIASIEVDPLDELPKCLCHSCYSLLQAAIVLKKTAQQSDIALRNTNLPEATNIDFDQDDSLIDYDDPLIKDDDPSFKYDDPIYESKDEKKEKDNVFHCKRCDLDFKSFTEYNNHRMTEEHETKRSQCPYCHKLYNATYLKRHLAIHKPETSYMCDICGKNFIVHGHFTRHRLTHFYSLPYKCSLCPYRGRFPESLKMHMRSHTGDKPYQCSQCPSRFISKSNLNKHMFTHKTEHDFKCETCGRGFYKKRDLEIHFKVDHTGVKDHVCNICGKAFGYRKQMMKHQLKVHKREKLKSGRMPLYLQVEAKKNSQDEA